jgi:hypothetical protein
MSKATPATAAKLMNTSPPDGDMTDRKEGEGYSTKEGIELQPQPSAKAQGVKSTLGNKNGLEKPKNIAI